MRFINIFLLLCLYLACNLYIKGMSEAFISKATRSQEHALIMGAQEHLASKGI
jgi:hypothetical protein